MFNIGGGEMIMLAILALLVFGPESLPDIAKTVVRTMRAFRQASMDLQNEVREALEIENTQRKAVALAASQGEKVASAPADITDVPEPAEAPAKADAPESQPTLEAAEKPSAVTEGAIAEEPSDETEVEVEAPTVADPEVEVEVTDDDDGPGLPMSRPGSTNAAVPADGDTTPSADETKPVETAL